MIGRYAVLGRDICNIKYPRGCCSPNKEKEPGSAKLFFLWYNIIAKTIKPTKGFRRFLCRGKNNIRTEFLLLGLAYNIKKLFAKISENRLGISLFELKTA